MYKENAYIHVYLKEILKDNPLHSQANNKNPVFHAVITLFDSNAIWFISEYDADNRIAFGYANLGFPEFGYISINEFEDIEGELFFVSKINMTFDKIEAYLKKRRG